MSHMIDKALVKGKGYLILPNILAQVCHTQPQHIHVSLFVSVTLSKGCPWSVPVSNRWADAASKGRCTDQPAHGLETPMPRVICKSLNVKGHSLWGCTILHGGLDALSTFQV